MAISVLSAAKRLGEKSGWVLTNLQMQKMVYLAHMFFVGEYKAPLVAGDFEAWNFGPVHPVLYHHLKRYGAGPVPPDAFTHEPSMPDDHPGCKFLDAAVTELPRSKLIGITHWREGAWRKNYKPHESNIVISNKDILKEYKKRKHVA